MKFLVVDDERVCRRTLVKLLSQRFCDCQTEEACEGDAAVQKMVAERPQFDLVFMDIEINQGLNGDVAVKMFRAIEALNGGEKGERCNVVVLSSKENVKVEEFGGDLFVEKPMTTQKLDNVLEMFNVK
jgi:CheY-like chemotaxis protein